MLVNIFISHGHHYSTKTLVLQTRAFQVTGSHGGVLFANQTFGAINE